jgi:hypothetical protein
LITLPKLVEIVSRHDGRDQATIKLMGRNLREAGYISAGKRGAGASKLTAQEAVALLLGVYGSMAPKDAAETYLRLSSLVAVGTHIKEKEYEFLGQEEIEAQLSFHGAFSVLCDNVHNVQRAISNHREKLIVKRPHFYDLGEETFERNHGMVFQIKLFGTSRAEMSLNLMNWGVLKSVWRRRFRAPEELVLNGLYGDTGRHDRRVEVIFELDAITEIHDAVIGEVRSK